MEGPVLVHDVHLLRQVGRLRPGQLRRAEVDARQALLLDDQRQREPRDLHHRGRPVHHRPHRRPLAPDDDGVRDDRAQPVEEIDDALPRHPGEQVLVAAREAHDLVGEHRPHDQQEVVVEDHAVDRDRDLHLEPAVGDLRHLSFREPAHLHQRRLVFPQVVVEAQQVVAALDETTALVSIPLVSYTNGALMDVAPVVAAAHAQGALVLLDAYQGAGSVPIDVKASGVDFLVAGTLKYLLGTAGIAFLYVSPQVRQQLMPVVTGWFGRSNPFDFNPSGLSYADAAKRFDLGTPPLINAFAARAGIDLIRETGVEQIKGQVDRLSALAYRVAPELGLRILGPQQVERKGAITAIDAGSVECAHWLEGELRKHGVIASARGEAMRLAAHGFTLEAELEQALRTVALLLEQAPAEVLAH